MKKLVSILLFGALMFSLSCSKEVKLNKRMNGEWEPNSMKIITPAGLSYFVESVGFMRFDEDRKKNTGTYTIDISYEFNGSSQQLNETGSYTISGDQIMRSYDSIQNESRVVYINKDYLEFEIPNLENNGYFFVLKRK